MARRVGSVARSRTVTGVRRCAPVLEIDQGPFGDQRMDVLEVFVPPANALRSCGLVEGVAGTVSTMSLTIRLGGRAAVRVPARGTHAAGIAVMIHVTHAATWAAMEFLCSGVPACLGAPTHSVAHRLSAWDTPKTDRLAASAAAARVATNWRTSAHSTPVIDACGFIAWSVSLLARGPDCR